MRKTVAAALLAIAPTLAFASAFTIVPVLAAGSALGDVTTLRTIISDTQGMVALGDIGKAQSRITDFETAWDRAAPSLQPQSPEQWHSVDAAADAALKALRESVPDLTQVETTLNALAAALDDPRATPGIASSSAPAAFSVTNADGSPLPCEVALKSVRDRASTRPPSDSGQYDTLVNKGIERCNADDDKRADGFFAQAYALLG